MFMHQLFDYIPKNVMVKHVQSKCQSRLICQLQKLQKQTHAYAANQPILHSNKTIFCLEGGGQMHVLRVVNFGMRRFFLSYIYMFFLGYDSPLVTKFEIGDSNSQESCCWLRNHDFSKVKTWKMFYLIPRL